MPRNTSLSRRSLRPVCSNRATRSASAPIPATTPGHYIGQVRRIAPLGSFQPPQSLGMTRLHLGRDPQPDARIASQGGQSTDRGVQAAHRVPQQLRLVLQSRDPLLEAELLRQPFGAALVDDRGGSPGGHRFTCQSAQSNASFSRSSIQATTCAACSSVR